MRNRSTSSHVVFACRRHQFSTFNVRAVVLKAGSRATKGLLLRGLVPLSSTVDVSAVDMITGRTEGQCARAVYMNANTNAVLYARKEDQSRWYVLAMMMPFLRTSAHQCPCELPRPRRQLQFRTRTQWQDMQ